jgi:hypothetical protein
MNDSDEPWSDEAIDDLLGPLRTAKLPDEVRSANREAVRRALARRACPPWWRRSVAVPMPLALAASLALVVTAAASLWPVFGNSLDMDGPLPQRESVVESGSEIPGWRVTRSYILSIESLARMQDTFRPDVTEKRNDP